MKKIKLLILLSLFSITESQVHATLFKAGRNITPEENIEPNLDQPVANDYYVSDYGAMGDGVTDDLDAIQEAVKDFAADPLPATLHFEDKVYRCLGGGKLLEFTGAKDKTILGNGAEMLIEPRILGVQILDSDNILIKDIKFDYDPLTWTQGTIKNIDETNKKFSLEIDTGYPIPTDNYRDVGRPHPWGMIWEASGYNIKNSLVWIDASTKLTNNTVELTLKSNSHSALDDMQLNDRFTIDVYGVGGTLNNIRGSKNITCENLTFYSARSLMFGIIENEGEIRMNGVQIRRRPGTDRLISGYRDGFHCKKNKQGPIIENCYIDGICDDAINLSGSYYYVTGKSSSTQFQMDDASSFSVGDTLLFVDMKNGIDLGKTIVAATSGNDVTTVSAIEGVVAGAVLEENTTFVMNLNKSNSGYIIRNNTFGGQRRYAMLIRSPNGLIENNIGTNLDGGIILTNEVGTFNEGPFPRNIMIRNNSFTEIRRWPLYLNSSSFKDFPEPLLQDITFINNTFGNDGVGIAPIFRDVDNVVLKGNKFYGDAAVSEGIQVINSTNIKIECDNQYNETKISSIDTGINAGKNVSTSNFSFDCDPLSIGEDQLKNKDMFQIIPNPVEEKFGIETAIESFQIEIMDINGRLVKRINNPSEVIDVSDLSSGVYLINLITEEGEYQRKIIKS